ncbi:hypothetical protein Tco_0843224 [Tanacetum coccineum]|uniref:Uncharacterized protein n=1 Tax=Tanacetum coccineum TaxID=301880 RepID=A0ABQ5B3R3_9ASTR
MVGKTKWVRSSWDKILKWYVGNVPEVIDVENWRIDNSRVLRWVVSLIEWNSSVLSTKSSIQSPFRLRSSLSRSRLDVIARSLMPSLDRSRRRRFMIATPSLRSV